MSHKKLKAAVSFCERYNFAWESRLNPTELEVVKLAIGSNNQKGWTIPAIGYELNMSPDRVRQTQDKATNKLNSWTYNYFKLLRYPKLRLWIYLNNFAYIQKLYAPIFEQLLKIVTKIDEVGELHVVNLGLSVRANNCLCRTGIQTITELVDQFDELPWVNNLGSKTIDEISNALNAVIL